jgi:hypothetical protein
MALVAVLTAGESRVETYPPTTLRWPVGGMVPWYPDDDYGSRMPVRVGRR